MDDDASLYAQMFGDVMDDASLFALCQMFPTSAPYMIEQARPLTDAQENAIERIVAVAEYEVLALAVDGSRTARISTPEIDAFVEIAPSGTMREVKLAPGLGARNA